MKSNNPTNGKDSTQKTKLNRGGAPKKDKKDKIFKGYKMYFTYEEHQKLEEYITENNLKNISKSKLLKKIIDLKLFHKPFVLIKKTDPKELSELNKIGINLNQIARKLNTENFASNTLKKNIEELLSTLKEKIR